MTETQIAATRPVGVLHWVVLLRDLVARYPLAFMLIWVGGLVALAPLSLLPGTAPPTGVWDVDLSFDKFFHVIAYGGAAGIPMLALRRASWRILGVAVALAGSLAYEVGQHYVPGRSFGYDDLLANLGGVALGVVLGAWMRRLPPRG